MSKQTKSEQGAEDDGAYRLMLTQVTVDKLADMIIWLDEGGRYVFVNPAATRLLGYSADELSCMHLWDVDPLFDEARWRGHWQDVLERESFKIETVNRTKSGCHIPIEVTVNLVEYEGRRFNCAIVRDITERQRVEAELRELNDQIYRLSVTDALTGLANRRHFDLTLDSEVRRHAQSKAPLSLILLDVDAFKLFNDTYGHIAGDEALQTVTAALQRSMAGAGLTARYGGEEFACILPETDHAAALAVAERGRRDIAALGLPHATSPVSDHVTISLGVVTAACHERTRTVELLRAVDAALYRAKRQGRNQAVGESLPA